MYSCCAALPQRCLTGNISDAELEDTVKVGMPEAVYHFSARTLVCCCVVHSNIARALKFCVVNASAALVGQADRRAVQGRFPRDHGVGL